MLERFDPRIPSNNPAWRAFARDHERRYEQAVEALAGRTYPVIIDAAFGAGYGYGFLKDFGAYTGVDYSIEAVRLAKSRYPEGRFLQGDLDDASTLIGLGPADAIVSLETAEHLRWPGSFLTSCWLALKDDGVLIFSVPTCPTMDIDPYHRRDWGVSRWRDEIRKAGFRVTSSLNSGFAVPFRDLMGGFPTTLAQKAGIGWRMLRRGYVPRRLWEWVVLGQFRWKSTLFVCKKA